MTTTIKTTVFAMFGVGGLAVLLTGACGSNEDADDDDEVVVPDAGSSAEQPDAQVDPPTGYCGARACGADVSSGEWCGPACDLPAGCGEDGLCGEWPPALDSIYNGNKGWRLPACSHSDNPGSNLDIAIDRAWVKTMKTISTTCPVEIEALSPMAKVGTVATEDTSVPVFGSCVEYSDGQWGTAHDGWVLWGNSWLDYLPELDFTYVISWRALIDHNVVPAAGIGIAALGTDTGDFCEITMEVTYERCPEDRNDCGSHPKPW